MQCLYLFKDSKDCGDNYNLNKHIQSDGLNETESTTNTYEQTTPSELVAGEHLYEVLPTGKTTHSFSSATVWNKFIKKNPKIQQRITQFK